MLEKLTLQHIVDAYIKQTGASKKTADALSKAFFETITNGLNADGQVKVNGLGTFKVVDVAERESVNVNNGERIVIAGYKKVTFIPAERFGTEIPAQEASQQPTDVPPTVQLDIPIIENVEQPQNEFSAIDMLISTPESMDEIRESYEKAKQRAFETLKAANEANAEMLRLEKLVQRLETNTPPQEHMEATPLQTEADTDADAEPGTASESTSLEASRDEALLHYLNDKPIHDEKDSSANNRKSWLYWLLIPILGILLAAGAIYIYRNTKEAAGSASEKKPADVRTKAPDKAKPTAKPLQSQPSSVKNVSPAKADSVPPRQPATATTPSRPKTYVMKPGDSLTKIAQKMYGSKDSVRLILRANKFPNPDNIPVGATINLP